LPDSKAQIYNQAMLALTENKKAIAHGLFAQLGDYKDSQKYVDELHLPIQYVPLQSFGYIKNDGAVFINEDYSYYLEEIAGWDNIVSFTRDGSLLGLRKDGTVVSKFHEEFIKATEDVKTWTEIVQIDGSGYSYFGLKKDGTVLATTEGNVILDDIQSWSGIKSISVSEHIFVGLKNDGSVIVSNEIKKLEEYYNVKFDVSEWTDIIMVSVGDQFIVGLKKDGTVVVTQSIATNIEAVNNWTDIVSIYAGRSGKCVGMKSDGSLVSSDGKVYDKYSDIVYVWLYSSEIFGLRSNGTIVLVNLEEFAEPENIYPFLHKAKNVKIP
jgi:hypothetical protein